MKKMMMWACVLGLLAGTRGLAADNDTAEAALKDMLKLMKDATAVMETMTDEDTVNAATPKLKKIGVRKQELTKRLQSVFKDLSKEDQEAIRKTHGKEMESARKALQTEAKRVEKLPGGKEALKLIGPIFGERTRPKVRPKDKKENE